MIVTFFPSEGVAATWYSVPWPAVSSAWSSVNSTQSSAWRPKVGSSLRPLTVIVSPLPDPPPLGGSAVIRTATEPFSLDHLNVAVPSWPGSWISTRYSWFSRRWYPVSGGRMQGRSEPAAADEAASVPVLAASSSHGCPTVAQVGTGDPAAGTGPEYASLTCHTTWSAPKCPGRPTRSP